MKWTNISIVMEYTISSYLRQLVSGRSEDSGSSQGCVWEIIQVIKMIWLREQLYKCIYLPKLMKLNS